ncbi:MAG: hypothetical protein U9R48_10855, partial [Chloroflexota bacterium]|nr:hypothetical protein [Chloroflexota bacterium]
CLSLGAVAGCQLVEERSRRGSFDWSRGQKLGQAALNNRPALEVDEATGEIYVAWIAAEGETSRLHFVHLDSAGHILLRRDLPFRVSAPSKLQLAASEEGELHVAWMDGLGEERSLFWARMGEQASPPVQISPPGVLVDSYAMARGGGEGVHAFWGVAEGEGQGLYYTPLTGDDAGDSFVLRERGFAPGFRVDPRGAMHVVWREEPSFSECSIYYATFDGQKVALRDPHELVAFSAPLGVVIHGPELGLTHDRAYVFWSSEVRGGGMSRPMAESYYVTFPLGQPQVGQRPQNIRLPAMRDPSYEVVDSVFNVHQLAPAGALAGASFVYMPSAVRVPEEALAVAFAVELVGRTRSIVQPVLTIWGEGAMQGYQVVSKTRNVSLRPSLLADAGKDLHLVWIDSAGFGTYDVYYASTAPAVRAHLNRVTGRDVMAAVFDFAWALAQAASFFPLLFAWIFMPLALIAIYSFIRAEGSLALWGPRIVLALSILLYVAFKYLFQPNWLGGLPLPRCLPLRISNVLMYAAPFAIAGLAGGITWLHARQRERASLFPTFLVFVVSDTLLTLLIYVPGILAE